MANEAITGWESPKEVKMKRGVAYRAQSDFRIPVDLVTIEKKQGELITDPYIISKLLSVNAPILPVSGDEVDIIPCPHCKRDIELSKIPAVKDYINSLKK